MPIDQDEVARIARLARIQLDPATAKQFGAQLETILGLHADDPASGLGGGPSRGVIITSVEIVER